MKKKKIRRPRVALSQKQIEKMKRQISDEATKKALLLSIAVMADDLNMTDEEICKTAESLNRYVGYLDKHLIRLNEVADIIEKHTGLVFGRFE